MEFHPYEIIGIIAGCFLIASMWIKTNVLAIKSLFLAGAILFLIYGILNELISIIILNVVAALVTIRGIYILQKKPDKLEEE
jgi:hypothetical protein